MESVYKENSLFCCDNLELLEKIPDETIDLIYCDILYGTGKKFDDFKDIKAQEEIVKEFYEYRLALMNNKLKKTGSIYIQVDTRINHWIRIIMDEIFGYDNFRNEIIWWKKSFSDKDQEAYLKRHDVILFYTKTDNYYYETQFIYNEKKQKRMKKGYWDAGDAYLIYDEEKFMKFKEDKIKKGKFKDKKEKLKTDDNFTTKCHDVIDDIDIVKHNSPEYVEYSCQKPLKLMERILLCSSKENDLVADFFMGSGSFVVQAAKMNRRYIGCDINPKSVEITRDRLKNT